MPPVHSLRRTNFVLLFNAVAPATAETLLTTVPVRDGVAGTPGTSHGVTAGSTLRITSVEFGLAANAAASAFGTLRLRSNPAGATLIGSQIVGEWPVGNTEAVAGAARSIVVPVTDGLEFSGAMTIGLSLSAQAVTNIVSIALRGYEYVLPAQLR
jgi:hypothetical protein